LSVSLSHLNPDTEMRRFFGGKVIPTSRNESASSSRARRQPTVQRSNLTRPQSNWWPAKLREGLTLRPLTDDEVAPKASLTPLDDHDSGEKYWTVEYSKKYKGATLAFMQTVLSGGELSSVPELERCAHSKHLTSKIPKVSMVSCGTCRGMLIHCSS
jgi:hypothetical protein